jgi:L-amino acid N-acyltransferase YncA
MRIRLATPADGAQLQRIYAPVVAATAISFEWEPPTGDEMAGRVETTLRSHPWLVAEEHTVVGYAYASEHSSRQAYRWSTNVSVYIGEEARGQGVGRALYTALLAILRRQGFRLAVAGITLPNPASVGLHEAMGFVPVGVYHRVGWKLGAWHDVGYWELQLQAEDDPPGPLGSLDELSTGTLRAAMELGEQTITARGPSRSSSRQSRSSGRARSNRS